MDFLGGTLFYISPLGRGGEAGGNSGEHGGRGVKLVSAGKWSPADSPLVGTEESVVGAVRTYPGGIHL